MRIFVHVHFFWFFQPKFGIYEWYQKFRCFVYNTIRTFSEIHLLYLICFDVRQKHLFLEWVQVNVSSGLILGQRLLSAVWWMSAQEKSSQVRRRTRTPMSPVNLVRYACLWMMNTYMHGYTCINFVVQYLSINVYVFAFIPNTQHLQLLVFNRWLNTLELYS